MNEYEKRTNALWAIIQEHFTGKDFTAMELAPFVNITDKNPSMLQLRVYKPLRALLISEKIELKEELGTMRIYRITDNSKKGGDANDGTAGKTRESEETADSGSSASGAGDIAPPPPKGDKDPAIPLEHTDIPICRTCPEPAQLRGDGISTGYCPKHLDEVMKKRNDEGREQRKKTITINFSKLGQEELHVFIVSEAAREMRNPDAQIVYWIREMVMRKDE